MPINKKIKVFLSLVLTLSFVQFMMPNVSLGQDLSTEADQRVENGIVLYIGSPTSYVNNTKTMIDTSNEAVFPIIRGERTLVPVRFLSESIGANVQWDGEASSVTITLKDTTVKLSIGSSNMLVNNKVKVLEVAPQITEERTFVPLRALVEALGKDVFYDRNLIIVSDQENIIDPVAEKDMVDELISRVNVLPSVESYDKLKELLGKAQAGQTRYYALDTINAPQAVTKNESISGSADYSKTNVQVEGVDEADIVKNDGEYIYKVNGNQVVVAKAYPASEMKVLSTLSFDDKNFNPQELYLDGARLVVIGSTYHPTQTADAQRDTSLVESKMIMPPYYYGRSTVKAVIFDITNKENISKVNDIEVDGSYVSSRKIGDSVYLVSNQNANVYYIQNEENIVPCYKDANISEDFTKVDYSKIYYFPGCISPNYMNVATIRLNDRASVNVSSYLGAGEQIYASANNLYVSATDYNYDQSVKPLVSGDLIMPPVYENNTIVYKFALQDGAANYKGKGEVPGRIDNQFSMDENNDYFRITTTTGEMWRTDENTSKNNLYVLDREMNIVGRLEGLAPGERIYSTRFMGDRAYMVTFKNTDPLFVIDLKEPTRPQLMGELKIPGYSEYLHPYDETHIIGFGKNAIPSKDSSFAWYQGMKIALFDVSDVNNPKEMYTETIGDRGTDSELLYNHKALLFSKEKNLLAFPVTVMEVKDGANLSSDGIAQYGTFTFQGAYVYNLDLENGFKLKGKITHITDEEYQKAGDYWYDSSKNIQRIIYMGENLYTISNAQIDANGMIDLQKVNSLKLPAIESGTRYGGPIVY